MSGRALSKQNLAPLIPSSAFQSDNFGRAKNFQQGILKQGQDPHLSLIQTNVSRSLEASQLITDGNEILSLEGKKSRSINEETELETQTLIQVPCHQVTDC
jgi:hypothetical protein